MSSRQVNFYVHPDEQEWLEARMRSSGPFMIVRGIDQDGQARLCTTIVMKEFGKEELRIFLVRPDDLESIRFLNVPSREELFIDDLRSPVVEFSRCYFDGRVLRRGRLYFSESYYGDRDQLVNKPGEFVAWGRKLVSDVRKALARRADGDYVSERAREMEGAAGLKLTAA